MKIINDTLVTLLNEESIYIPHFEQNREGASAGSGIITNSSSATVQSA